MSGEKDEEMECQSKEEDNDDMEEEDDSEEDSDDDDIADEKEGQLRLKVTQLRKQISDNKLYYDGHISLIAALRELVELEEARQAREAMSEIYPLSPELWLEWLRDEQKVCTTKKEREYITSLFDRAVKDYTNVQVWVEYVMFMLGGGDMDASRAVGDRALTAVGTHVSEGILVWQVVQLVEKQVYAGLQQKKPGAAVHSEQDKKEQEKQLRRIQTLYRRQARVLLLNADPQVLLEEASNYFEGGVESQMKVDIEKGQKKLNEKIPFEDELFKCENEVDKLAIYRRYIIRTQETDNPAVVQSLYERAVTDLCLRADLWEEYVRFVIGQFQGLDYVVLPVCERSQRNCPWSASLCMLHIRALQLFADDAEEEDNINTKIKGALEKGLGCGLQSGSEATRMWMAYLIYLRRLIKWDQPHDAQLEAFRVACQQAIDMIDTSFGEEGDIESEIPRFWARIEGEFAKIPERARGIWNDIIMKRNDNFKSVNLWLEFINLERSYGTEKHCRKLFRRALERVWDHVELIGDAYLRFEQEAGTLETMEDYIKRYVDRMTIIKRKRAEDAAKLEAEQQAEESKFGRQKGGKKQQDKKKSNMDRHTNGHSQGSHVFKVPHQVPKQAKVLRDDSKGHSSSKVHHSSSSSDVRKDASQSIKTHNASSRPPGSKKDIAPPPGFKNDVAPPPGFKDDVAPPPGFKNEVTPPPGLKSEVPPPPGFKNDASPAAGIKREAEGLEDEPQAKKSKIAEQYGLLTEKEGEDDLCTVFISNLEFDADKKDIIPLFSGCGEIKDFRLVRDFKCRSKGYGYLVFKNQDAVKKAIELDRILHNGRPVYVSRYDPVGQTHHFKFPTAIEKNKLFIRGLQFNMTQDNVKEAFQLHGDIKDIRLVTYRNGHSKGTCYIEYHDEETAEKVRQAMDGTELQGKEISVLISNPPSKYKDFTKANPIPKEVSLGGGNKGKKTAGVRAKGMFDLMPRSLMRASGSSPSTSTTTTSATDDSVKPKSNEDFRKMFLNK